MNLLLLSTFAVVLSMLITACASHQPAPVTTTTSTTETQEVHTY
jgi:hypothetical protein